MGELVRVYEKRAGHCTRCAQTFAERATRFMVTEDVVWRWIDADTQLFHQAECVSVCESCLTPKEGATTWHMRACPGCQQPLALAPCHDWPRAACSSRCTQRARRARKHATRLAFCQQCGLGFRPTRTDSRYHSRACRQRAYRQRHSQPHNPPSLEDVLREGAHE